jgi:hypothetical protein
MLAANLNGLRCQARVQVCGELRDFAIYDSYIRQARATVDRIDNDTTF